MAVKDRKGLLAMVVALLGLGGAVAALRRYGSVTGVLAAATNAKKAAATKVRRVANRRK